MTIHTVHWGRVPLGTRPEWLARSNSLIAIWPAPIDGDFCFREAGFVDFADSDSDWDEEFETIITKLFEWLKSHHGVALAHDASPIAEWPRSPDLDEPAILDRLVLATYDDRFPETIASFGDPITVKLRTSDGHPILWLGIAEGASLGLDDLLAHLAEGRAIEKMDLKWQHLLSHGCH